MSGGVLPPRVLWEDIVRRGLREDLGGAGDLTTDAIVPADLPGRAHIVTRQPGVVAGLPIAAVVFELLDPEACLEPNVADGEGVAGLGLPLVSSEFVQSMTDAQLFAFISAGRDAAHPDNTTGVAMPPRGGNPSLSDEDLADVVAFLRTLQ